jgi:hypothetical protein
LLTASNSAGKGIGPSSQKTLLRMTSMRVQKN